MAKRKKMGTKRWIYLGAGVLLAGIVAGVLVYCLTHTKEEKSISKEEVRQPETVGEMQDGEIIDYEKLGKLTLEKYVGLKGTVTPTKEDIYRFILDKVEKKKCKIQGEERVKSGDWVIMDYKGTINGETNDDLEEEGIVIQVGAGDLFNADFERKLTGLSLGQEYSFDVEFPKNYYDEDVVGKKVTFTVTIDTKYNGSFVGKLSNGKYHTEKEYYKYAEQKVRQENVEALGDTLWDDYLGKCKVNEYPKGSTKQAYKDLQKQYKGVGELSGMSYEEIISDLGMTDEDVKGLAKDEVKSRMTAKTIAAKEGLKLSEEQYRKYLEPEVSLEDVEEKKIEELEEDYRKNVSVYPKDDMLVKLVREYIGKKAELV